MDPTWPEIAKPWAVVVDPNGEPQLAVNVDDFTRAALFGPHPLKVYEHCHRPVVVRDRTTTLGDVIRQLKTKAGHTEGPLEHDVVLIWLEERRILTGSDILARLLTGIGRSEYV